MKMRMKLTYSEFYNPTTQQLELQCNHTVLDNAYLEGKLTGMYIELSFIVGVPHIVEPSPPSLSESAACLTRELKCYF